MSNETLTKYLDYYCSNPEEGFCIAQVIQEHVEEIDAYLRQESRYWCDQHPEVDVRDGDQTLDDIAGRALRPGISKR